MTNASTHATIAILFTSLSLVSIGGGNTVLPEIQHQAVDVHRWLSDRQFADVYAIAEAAPGPSSMIVSLVGLGAAGLPGALIAVLAMFTPTCVLTYFASRAWEQFHDSKWRIAAERGLVPITVGLVFATGLMIVRAADHTPAAFAITAVTAVVLARTRLSPLVVMAGAAVLGVLGLV